MMLYGWGESRLDDSTRLVTAGIAVMRYAKNSTVGSPAWWYLSWCTLGFAAMVVSAIVPDQSAQSQTLTTRHSFDNTNGGYGSIYHLTDDRRR
jgi:hypothetical protein